MQNSSSDDWLVFFLNTRFLLYASKAICNSFN